MYRASRSPSASSPADRNTVLTSAAGAEHTAKPSDMHSTDMTHLRGPSGSTRFLRLRAGPRRRRPIGPVWRLNSARKKVIGRLKEGFSEILRRGTLATYEIFGQSNLSWLTSSMVPLHGPGKDLVAGALTLPMTRTHLSERRENNSCQSHTSWLTSLGLSAVVRGIDVPGRKGIPHRTPRKGISPIAYFIANSVARSTLNCRLSA